MSKKESKTYESYCKLARLENKFDNFVRDFYNELKDLKEKVKEEYPTVCKRIDKIVRDAKSIKRDIIKITISEDIKKELIKLFPPGHLCSSIGRIEIMGIPIEVDRTCYDTIAATIR
jgi:hypothetical protein